jgi:chemosensory pili system protein ChpA (sensor histidine kinase/response regulator)
MNAALGAAQDLGPLAWVLEDARASLIAAGNALCHIAWDERAEVSDHPGQADARYVREAQKKFHQSAGVLEMAGQPIAAKVLRSLAALTDKFEQVPEVCTAEAVRCAERASRSVIEYLEGLLKGSRAASVALFPQYSAIMELCGAERIHPADLWHMEWQWQPVDLPDTLARLHYGPDLRSRMTEALLPVLKTLDRAQAQQMVQWSGGLAAGEASLEARTFWALVAGFCEAIALGCLPDDVYVRRTAAKILPQFAVLASGQSVPSDRTAQDLLFFCALANPSSSQGGQMLLAVRSAYGLGSPQRLDYATSRFGRFDPLQLSLVRQRLAAATESWSAVAGGDISGLPLVLEQFVHVGESVSKLNAEHLALVTALRAAVQALQRAGAGPSPAVALEVATAILYLEAAYDDRDLASETLEHRSARLAQRLQQACSGGEPQPIESWIEDLYRQVNVHKNMGTLVLELRQSLAEIEKSLDRYTRDPADASVLQDVPTGLGQMRGVFSVLGLDQAALAALRIRASMEQLLTSAAESPQPATALAPQLVRSLSTMGFMIDMLAYQPATAKDLFVYDQGLGEFKPLMDRERALVQRAAAADACEPPRAAPGTLEAGPVPAGFDVIDDEGDDDNLLAIFLEEARDVVSDGRASLQTLALTPDNLSAQQTLRRSFHTLKGSARMVELSDLGDAAWAFEQCMNTLLAEQRPAGKGLVLLCEEALGRLSEWIEALAKGQSPPWTAMDFRRSVDTLELPDQYLALPDVLSAPTESVSDPVAPTMLPVRSSIYQDASQAHRASDAKPMPEIAIGHLRLSADFFEVFLEEAQVWANKLQSEISQWDLQAMQPPPESTAALAHAIQGSASAVGFTGLQSLARALEQAVQHFVLHRLCGDLYKAALSDGAHEVTRLLAGFSIGTLVEPSPTVLQALAALLVAPVTTPLPAPFSDFLPDGHTFGDGGVVDGNAPQPPVPSHAPPLALNSFATVDALSETSAPDHLDAAWAQDFDAQDVLDADLLPIFLEEGAELLTVLSSSLRNWAERPDSSELRGQALRTLHTLKGSARLAGGLRLGELAHRMESALEGLDLGPESLQPATLVPIEQQLDQLVALFDGLKDAAPSSAEAPAALPTVSPSLPTAQRQAPAAGMPTLPVAVDRGPQPVLRSSLRVSTKTLDRLIDQAGEAMVSRQRVDGHVTLMRSTLGEFGRNLDRLRLQLRDLELQAELQMQSTLKQASESTASFDPLELDRFTALQEVTRMIAESVGDVDAIHQSLLSDVGSAQEDLFAQRRGAKQLAHDLLRMRLVEFDAVSDRLYAVVRQACKGTDKQVRLDIVGGSMELDRGVLERMMPAFEHLLRNAVVHGIEPSEVRRAAGKPATGAISLALHQEGSDVSVTLADDGAGLQLEKIQARALASGLLEPGQALDLEEAIPLLFVPGFSTADAVTELAGRGIGMDVVLSEVNAIGGRIETESQPGLGTRFKVVFPLTTAVTQVVVLRMGTITIGVPAKLLETVLRLPTAALDAAYSAAHLAHGDTPAIPFFWGGALLKASTRSYGHKTVMRQHAVAVVRSAGQRVALHVDEVVGSREVVVKNLGPQLSRLPGLTGMSVLASGDVVLIYNPVALASLYGEYARRVQSTAMSADGDAYPMTGVQDTDSAGQSKQTPLVLVVDDSITVRRVTQRLLQREGFRVALASDGAQALAQMHDQRPAVVLSDIEMPRMDGMELIRQIRRDPKFADLPIIVITSRIAQKHRDHALALGANHYLGKPYSDGELLGLVHTFCNEAELA